ncbi:MAG TPA: energy transducer TonB [Gallionellaceae bacterium]|nr:energy transducer TonB [Gallionellaceae bacterium]
MKDSHAMSEGAESPAARAIIFALVISAHVAILSVWSAQPNVKAATNNELSVSFAVTTQASQASISKAVTPQPAKAAVAQLPVAERIAEQAPVAAAEQPAAVAAPSVATAAVADSEPEYKAAYLNNPPPQYPMVARRNGLQGRVLLSVEVLADGACGQISIQKSSGYAMLDNAALQTVKSWRFVPARQAGHAVDKWFMIPVQFSLKDNAA